MYKYILCFSMVYVFLQYSNVQFVHCSMIINFFRCTIVVLVNVISIIISIMLDKRSITVDKRTKKLKLAFIPHFYQNKM